MLELHHIIAISIVSAKLALRSKAIRYYGSFLVLTTIVMIIAPVIDQIQMSRLPGEHAAILIVMSSIYKILLSPFIAPVFIHEDRLLDSFDVILPRPYSNASYLLGKLAGYVFAMTGIDYFCMILFFVFDVVVAHHAMSAWPYLLYPLIVTVPLCVFVFGVLTFLGYLWYPLVYPGTMCLLMLFVPLQDVEHVRYLDITGISLPLAYSTLTGFFALGTVLVQRMIYLSGGFAFLGMAIIIIERFRQSNTVRMNMLVSALSAGCLAGSLGFVLMDQLPLYNACLLRTESRDHHSQLFSEQSINIQSCDLDLVHINSTIDVTAHLDILNADIKSLSRILLRLNPGFKIADVFSDSCPLTYTFEKGILAIMLDSPLVPGNSLRIDISYRGAPDNEMTYLHIPENFRERIHRRGLLVLGKQVSFIGSRYVMLPPEADWYPIALPSVSIEDPGYIQRDLTQFSLQVQTSDKMVALSQGKRTETDSGIQAFAPETRLTQISLAIAPFNTMSIVIDDIEYSYSWVHKDVIGTPAFSKQQLTEAIRQFKNDVETKLSINYPFTRYRLVQSPVHYFGYNSAWDMNGIHEQPEIHFIDESPLFLKRFFWWDTGFTRDQVSRLVQRVFPNLSRTTPMSTTIHRKLNRSNVFFTPTGLEDFAFDPFMEYGGLFSQYSVFARGRLTTNGLFNVIAVHQLRNQTPGIDVVDDGGATFSGMYAHSLDRANYHFLSTMSLSDVLYDSQYHADAIDVVTSAAKSFFRLYASAAHTDISNVESILYNGIGSPGADFADSLKMYYSLDILALFDTFAHQRDRARFEFTDIRLITCTGDNEMYYNARGIVRNTTGIPGMVTCGLSLERETSTDLLDVYVEPYGVKEIGFTTSRDVRGLYFTWIPYRSTLPYGPSDIAYYSFDINTSRQSDETPLDGVHDLGIREVTEIIIDNLDMQCRAVDANSNILFILFNMQKRGGNLKLAELSSSHPPNKWRLAYPENNGASYYGPVSTTYYKRSGDGSSYVEYLADITEAGQYDLFLSVPRSPTYDYFGETTVHIITGDKTYEGTADIEKAGNTEEEWAYVGSYQLRDTVTIQITDKTDAALVIADAVKLSMEN